MSGPFLTATWSNVFLATYPVPPALLEPRLPPGLALDLRDGSAFVSLVAFEFLDTRVRGVAWPGYRDFAELNLRFYVRAGGERGVVYNEPYRAAPFVARRDDAPGRHAMIYDLTWGGAPQRISVSADPSTHRPPDDSVEHFFKEHRWGFGVTRRGRTLRYEVDHPPWDVHPVRSYSIELDFGAVYGPEWAFLGDAQPCSTVLAVGSPVTVWPKRS